jgi:hypothetical protein
MSLNAKLTLLGVAAAALAILLPVAGMAQQPLPGPRHGYYYRNDPGFAPRPDFPGAKQQTNKMSRSRHTQK